MNVIIHGKIICENEILLDCAIIYDDKIQKIIPNQKVRIEQYTEVIDAKGAFVAPGFINQHIHGCFGFDTMDEADENLTVIRKSLVKTGVTSFLPTTMTYDFPKINKTLQKIRVAMHKDEGASIIGCHLEGPFISKDYKGAQAEKNIIQPAFDLIEEYIDVIKLITLAPEKMDNFDFIRQCKAHRIIVSLGHSGASYEQAIMAIEAGASHITHIFNALPVLNHRQPGIVGAAMDSPVICELIADNIHVHPAMQRILTNIKGTDKIILITDSMRACMLEDGEYELGGQPVRVKNQTARLASGVIAGSVLTMDNAIKNFKNNTNLSWPEVIKMVTINPAKELGIYDQKGSIDIGKQADLTIFDDHTKIVATIVKGKLVYRRI